MSWRETCGVSNSRYSSGRDSIPFHTTEISIGWFLGKPQTRKNPSSGSDVVVSMDGHYVWSVPLNLYFFAGVGLSVHFLSGSGALVDDTFVEDLLDSVSAGFSLQAGLEYPLTDRVRLYGGSKFEVLGDLNYFELRGGLTIIWGGLVPGEVG